MMRSMQTASGTDAGSLSLRGKQSGGDVSATSFGYGSHEADFLYFNKRTVSPFCERHACGQTQSCEYLLHCFAECRTPGFPRPNDTPLQVALRGCSASPVSFHLRPLAVAADSVAAGQRWTVRSPLP